MYDNTYYAFIGIQIEIEMCTNVDTLEYPIFQITKRPSRVDLFVSIEHGNSGARCVRCG